jgi:hypothetical protein
MISRWAAVGLVQAEEHFRRIRGYRHLPLLKRALRADVSKVDATEEAAWQYELPLMPSNSTTLGTSPDSSLKSVTRAETMRLLSRKDDIASANRDPHRRAWFGAAERYFQLSRAHPPNR